MTSLRRTSLGFLALAMFLVGMTPTPASAEPPVKWRGNGAFIELSGSDGCVYSYVHASKGGTSAAPQTWLSFYVYDYCTGESIAYGSGQIANTALKVGAKSATLTVSPRSGANFWMEGSIGAITLTFTPDGVYSMSMSGHTEVEYPGHVVKSHGSWTYKSATVTGSIGGTTFTPWHAAMGTSRDRSIDIQRRSK